MLATLLPGCGGLNATHGVSPATFLLPGLGRVQPSPPAAVPTPAGVPAPSAIRVAQAR